MCITLTANSVSANIRELTTSSPVQYAIRHNIRNHTTFKSDEVIKKVASLIDTRHSVNLNKPDKVVLIEIFQVSHTISSPPLSGSRELARTNETKLFCGMSVVDGKEWEELKRYNMDALYSLPPPGVKKA